MEDNYFIIHVEKKKIIVRYENLSSHIKPLFIRQSLNRKSLFWFCGFVREVFMVKSKRTEV